MAYPKDLDTRTIQTIINHNIPITEFIFDTGTTIYCPFHDDKEGNKASAKIYYNETGTVLYCFSEGQLYTTYDYIEKVLEEKPLKYLMSFVKQSGKPLDTLIQEAKKIIKYFDKQQENIIQEYIKEYKDDFIGLLDTLYDAHSVYD